MIVMKLTKSKSKVKEIKIIRVKLIMMIMGILVKVLRVSSK